MDSFPDAYPEWSSILIRGVYEWIEPAWVKISDAGAEEKEERWDAPEGTGEAGKIETSAACVEYIS